MAKSADPDQMQHSIESDNVASDLCLHSLNDFSYFPFTSHPDAFYQVLSQLDVWFRRRSEE